MNQQEQLRQAYFQPQYAPPAQNQEYHDVGASGPSIATVVFVVFVVVGLMAAAFWFGFLEPIIKKLQKLLIKDEKATKDNVIEEQTIEEPYTPIIQLMPSDTNEEARGDAFDIDQRFVELNDKHGLLEKSYFSGTNLAQTGMPEDN